MITTPNIPNSNTQLKYIIIFLSFFSLNRCSYGQETIWIKPVPEANGRWSLIDKVLISSNGNLIIYGRGTGEATFFKLNLYSSDFDRITSVLSSDKFMTFSNSILDEYKRVVLDDFYECNEELFFSVRPEVQTDSLLYNKIDTLVNKNYFKFNYLNEKLDFQSIQFRLCENSTLIDESEKYNITKISNGISYKLNNISPKRKFCFGNFNQEDVFPNYVTDKNNFVYLYGQTSVLADCFKEGIWGGPLESFIAKIDLNSNKRGVVLSDPRLDDYWSVAPNEEFKLTYSSCCNDFQENNVFYLEVLNNNHYVIIDSIKSNSNFQINTKLPCELPSGNYNIRVRSTNPSSIQTNGLMKVHLSDPFVNFSIDTSTKFIDINDSIKIQITNPDNLDIVWLRNSKKINIDSIYIKKIGIYTCIAKHGECTKSFNIVIKNKNNKNTVLLESSNIITNIPKNLNKGLVKAVKNPFLIIIYFIVFIVIGSMIFYNKKNMQFVDNGHKDINILYNCIWYSLDLALPVIDLECSKYFMPKKDSYWNKFRSHYYRAHILIGYFFVALYSSSILIELKKLF